MKYLNLAFKLLVSASLVSCTSAPIKRKPAADNEAIELVDGRHIISAMFYSETVHQVTAVVHDTKSQSNFVAECGVPGGMKWEEIKLANLLNCQELGLTRVYASENNMELINNAFAAELQTEFVKVYYKDQPPGPFTNTQKAIQGAVFGGVVGAIFIAANFSIATEAASTWKGKAGITGFLGVLFVISGIATAFILSAMNSSHHPSKVYNSVEASIRTSVMSSKDLDQVSKEEFIKWTDANMYRVLSKSLTQTFIRLNRV